ncbi:YpdA family putative bacillithiol disulfide reductase [Parasegetibacter sp. NRK P23]|uniref:YpdA family putative bacillithiol disulfide reductase n=1 Tax=Parasegetibacter sp. NRK P23 TaxID=2942999 RepID=UPI0020443AC9|nr:YpdA family putative bacillithiol disulfide reductase [Parasegetibacter sp. NRK P23]MCM5528910.1 YpdA family putative bacillithiol disulfide reductase [Parasegetibacter sp. NRK P23]
MLYDVVIAGGGPIGLACGLAAKAAGLQYLILEKGCLVNSLYNYPLNMTFFSTSEKLEIGGVPFVSNNAKPTRPEALEYYRRVAVSARLNIQLREKVTGIRQQNDHHIVTTEHHAYHTKNVVLATGFYDLPYQMHVPGEELPKVTHYYKDPHFYALQHVLVVGANNSAVDAALETWRKGAQVTMVIREGEIGKRVKYWAKPDIENRIAEGSIRAFFHSTIAEIQEKSVVLNTPEGSVEIPNDYVIAMTGYQPDFTLLQQTGITLSDDEVKQPSYNPATMETNVPGIFLAGVVCGGLNTHVWFIENSREHADLIVRAILRKEDQRGALL